MIIGVLKEHSPEARVALIPDAAREMLKRNVKMVIEHGAGLGAFYKDSDYEKEGAETADRKEVIERADCIVTVSPVNPEDLNDWKPGRLLAGGLDPYNSKALIDELITRNVTSFSLELLPRTTLAQSMDILTSMATISGYSAVLDAALHYPGFFPMFMSAAGTIRPAKILIVGAGVAGLQAIATARRLGAVVEAFDVRSSVKEEVQSLGGKFVEVEGAREDASAGGYAVDQSEEYRKKQQDLIHQHAMKSDVIICTAQIPGKKAPVLLTTTTVESMKSGSVIVDLAASTGGNCQLTVNSKTVDHNGVTIIGRSDYPRSMPVDASLMFSNNLLGFIRLIVDDGGNLNLDWKDEIINTSCLTHGGKIMNEKAKIFYNQ